MHAPTRAIGELLAYTEPDPLMTPLRKTAVEIIRKALKESPTVEAAAERLCVSWRTVMRWRSKYPELVQ